MGPASAQDRALGSAGGGRAGVVRRIRQSGRRAPVAAGAAAATTVVILVLTLFPTSAGGSAPTPLVCVVCGIRGMADAASNFLLFAPLGIALAGVGLRLSWAVAGGVALSTMVEGAQFSLIPGRDANLADVLFNALGTGGGYLAFRGMRWGIRDDAGAGRLALVFAGLASLTIASTGLFARSDLPPRAYYGHWTDSPGVYQRYGGRVWSARLGELPIPPARLVQSSRAREALRENRPLVLDVIAGSPPSDIAKLFGIYSSAREEILLVGSVGDDLVVRYHSRANALRLDQLGLRLQGALRGTDAGEPLRIRLQRDRAGYCAVVNGRRTCRGYTAGSGWMFIKSAVWYPGWLTAALGALWLAGLFLPVGMLIRRRRGAAALVVVALSLTLVPWLVGLHRVSGPDVCGVVLGLAAGVRAGALWVRRMAGGGAPSRVSQEPGREGGGLGPLSTES